MLKSARLSELIGRLRQTYDLVIIDTPPVLPVADALIMGRWADGAVMAARFDASRLPLVERANRQLALAGIPVLGVVVNGVRGQDAAYGNYAYSYNYTGPGDRPAPSTVGLIADARRRPRRALGVPGSSPSRVEGRPDGATHGDGVRATMESGSRVRDLSE